MQKIFCFARSLQRPVVFIPPFIRAHDENPDRLPGKSIPRSFEQKVVPLHRYLQLVELRGRPAEIAIAVFSPASRMTTDGDQEVLAALGLQPLIVPQRA